MTRQYLLSYVTHTISYQNIMVNAFILLFFRALQEAQELFGVDFDFEEFDQYGDVYDDADDDDDDVRELLASCH